MDYEYTVLSENNYGVMQQELNSYGRYGWKLVNVVWDNDNAFACCDDAGRIDDSVSDIYLWPFQPVLKRIVSNTWYISY